MALPIVKRTKTTAAAKAMKAMKKTQRQSKVARGRGAKAAVFRGKKEKTTGGLRCDALMMNKRGKVVSKRASANGKRRFKHIEHWVEAVMEARVALHAKGFVTINGKTLQGKALYVKAKALCAARKGNQASTVPATAAVASAVASAASPLRAPRGTDIAAAE